MTIALTAQTDMSPVPRVDVTLASSDLLSGTATLTLRRRSENRYFLVRGAVGILATSTIAKTDYESGFGVPSLYEALCYNASGAYLGAVQLGTITVAFGLTVIQQPLNPRLSLIVDRLAVMARSPIVRRAPGDILYPEDAVVGTWVGAGPVRGPSDVTIAFATDTLDDAAMVQSTFGDYEHSYPPIWLIRTPPGQHIPRVFFAAVPELADVDLNVRFGGSTTYFSGSATEVNPPAPGVSPAVLRYSDVTAVFSTYSAMKAAYSQYSAIEQDEALIGAGG